MNLTYREMRADDIPATLIVRTSTRENALMPEQIERDYGVTPASVAEGLRSQLKGWVSEDSGRIVGFAIGDRSNGEVQVVALLPDYERRGIGRELLSRVQAWLFFEGHDRIWLYANPDPAMRAHCFYRHLGWRPTGERKGGDEVLVLARGARR